MRKLSVLVIHDQYKQPGGEDAVVKAEVGMLRGAGHRVVEFTRKNASIAEHTTLRNAPLFVSTTWNQRTYSQIRKLIAEERPDVAHCHNLIPLISPSAYYACKSRGVAVVQTLHNYRLLCPPGTLFRDGHVCQDCTRSLAFGVARGCYRKSRLQTATIATMLLAHRLLGTWLRTVDAYVALNRFARDHFVAAGLPTEKVHVKPNFMLERPAPRVRAGDYALFVGRLTPEKGVLELLQAWQYLPHIPLVVVGDGPLRDQLAQQVLRQRNRQIKLLGQLSADDTKAQMKRARFLVFPSRWYEPCPMTLLEAGACGVPVVGVRVGGIPEIVVESQTGLLCEPHNLVQELAAKANWAWAHPTEMAAMGAAAQRLQHQEYTAERNYELLINIYQSVLST